MKSLDDELKNALRQQDAPPDFAENVLARLATQKSQQENPKSERSVGRFLMRLFPSQALGRWASVGALAAALVAVGFGYHRVQLQKARELAAGEAAKQQLVLALRIAGGKLQLAKTKVNQINGMPTHSGRTEN